MKDIIFAITTRCLFAGHGLIAIWRAQAVWERAELWLLLCPVALLILESVFTIFIRGGEDYKWISPCVLIYLTIVVPSIWCLEIKRLQSRKGRHICNDVWGKDLPGCSFTNGKNKTIVEINSVAKNATAFADFCKVEKYLLYNNTNLGDNAIITTTPSVVSDTTVGSKRKNNLLKESEKTLNEIQANLDVMLSGVSGAFNETTWILVLHQLLLFILIIGRWLLPRGEGISRDELSQLLLVFIGVGADILEFVTETIKETTVRCDDILIILIMAIWSWSTLQFTLVLTASQGGRRTRTIGVYDNEHEELDADGVPIEVGHTVEEIDEPDGKCWEFFSNTEVWGILSTLLLQDGPFLTLRLYIMVARNVVHQMIVFFTCKNCLVLVLQIYRLIIIAAASEDDEEDEDGKMSIDTLDRAAMERMQMQEEKRYMHHEEKRYMKRQPSSPGIEVHTVSEKVKRGMKRSPIGSTDKLSYEKDYDKTSTDSYSYYRNDPLPIESKSGGKGKGKPGGKNGYVTPSKSLESTDSEFVTKTDS